MNGFNRTAKEGEYKETKVMKVSRKRECEINIAIYGERSI